MEPKKLGFGLMRLPVVCLTFLLMSVLMLSSCGTTNQNNPNQSSDVMMNTEVVEESTVNESRLESTESEESNLNAPELLYQGKASIRIVTEDGKVIYIDPYAGDEYDLTADLILVTHEHFDHNAIELVKSRAEDCVVIRAKDTIIDGEHQIFDFGYVKVEAVEAGYNSYHDVNQCVGYVLTFENEKSVYVTGDTSTTEQMENMADMEIDYAFYCSDGVYNMGIEEAVECAKTVGAKVNIPYHMLATTDPMDFDRNLAEQFDAPGAYIMAPGDKLLLE